MRRRLILLVTLIAVLATATAATAAATIEFYGAGGGGHVRPRTLFLTGDGTLDVFRVHWKAWGGTAASGHGTAEWHGCTPNCASGIDHQAYVTVKLSNIRRCGRHQYYTHVILRRRSGRRLFRRFLRLSYKPCDQ